MYQRIAAFSMIGDILAIDKETNKTISIEVKNDSRIADTRNVLCEEEVYYKSHDYYGRGNMYANNDVFCVVSIPERKIYVLDFKILKANYRRGEYREIKHQYQSSFCYLCNLHDVKEWGAMIAEIEY